MSTSSRTIAGFFEPTRLMPWRMRPGIAANVHAPVAAGCPPRRAPRPARRGRTCARAPARSTPRWTSCRSRADRGRAGSARGRSRGSLAFAPRLLQAQLPDGQELEDPVLHVAQAVVILVEDRPRPSRSTWSSVSLVPGQIRHPLEPRHEDLRLGRRPAPCAAAARDRAGPPAGSPAAGWPAAAVLQTCRCVLVLFLAELLLDRAAARAGRSPAAARRAPPRRSS